MSAAVHKLKVTEQETPQRIDLYIASRLPQMSRAHIQKMSRDGKVELNGKSVRSKQLVRKGDVITIRPEDTTTLPLIKLPVLYEDSNCLVIDKPTGLLTHSKGTYNPEPTVASFVQQRVPNLTGDRAGIVHRLDRGTSGVMICAKNPSTLLWLQKQFSQRKVNKVYTAIIEGSLTPEEAFIDMPIERNPKLPSIFRVSSNGKPAITRYTMGEKGPHYSLVMLEPQTGRTHQLRVHLKYLGHPIVGDTLYQGVQADRLYLHAISLELTLPSGIRRIFSSKLPTQFMKKLTE